GGEASLTAPDYGYKEIDVLPVPSLNEQLRQMTSNRPNPGLAAMPPQQRPLAVDGRDRGASLDERPRRDAMAGQSQSEATRQHTSYRARDPHEHAEWDAADWGGEHDEAAGHRARRLLSQSHSSIHRIGDRVAAVQRWLIGERWVRRL